MEISSIEMTQVLKFNQKERAQIIDIREAREFEYFHIPDSINISPMGLVNNPHLFLKKDERYYILCYHGNSSLEVARILKNSGYDVYSINGGIAQYEILTSE